MAQDQRTDRGRIMGKDHRAKKTPEQYKKLADLLGENMPVTEALEKAGWSKQQAAKGWQKVPAGVIRMLPKSARRLIELAKQTPEEDMRSLVEGRLIDNITTGSDKAAQSAKILGSTKKLGMFTPDQFAGLIVLQMPQSMIDRKAELLAPCDDEVIVPEK